MSAVATMPTVRGKLTPNAPLAPLVWFKSGGNAEWLFEPKDEDDLADFLRELDPDVPVMALGLGSNLIVRDGGVPRRRRPPRQAVREDRPARRDHPALRRRGERHPRLLDRARRRHRRPRVPARHPRHRRRLRPDERRRLWPRGQRHPASRRASRLRSGEVVEWPLEQLGYTYRHSEVPAGAVVIEAMFRGTPGDPEAIGAEMDAHRPRPRGIAAARAAAPAARPSRTRPATRPGRWSTRRAAAASASATPKSRKSIAISCSISVARPAPRSRRWARKSGAGWRRKPTSASNGKSSGSAANEQGYSRRRPDGRLVVRARSVADQRQGRRRRAARARLVERHRARHGPRRRRAARRAQARRRVQRAPRHARRGRHGPGHDGPDGPSNIPTAGSRPRSSRSTRS